MKFFSYVIAGLLLTLPGVSCSFGQPVRTEFEKLTREDGLSSNLVICIYKDSRGFMWFGTQNGLNRYNAYEFDVWKHVPGKKLGLPNNKITDISEDNKGNIWIATSNGICYYNYRTGLIRECPVIVGRDTINNLKIKKLALFDSKIIIATNQGAFISVHQNNMLKSNRIRLSTYELYSAVSIALDKEKRHLWIGTFKNGVYKYDLTNNQAFHVRSELVQNDIVTELHLSFDDKLLIGTSSKGLIAYDIQSKKEKNIYLSEEKPRKIFKISSDNKGNYWISKGYELFLCDPDFKIRQVFKNKKDEPQSRSPGYILDIYCDDRNTTWLAFGYSGVNIYKQNAKPFIRYYVSIGNPLDNTNYVYSLAFDKKGDKWLSLFNKGLLKYDRNNKLIQKYTRSNSGLPDNMIFDILIPDKKEIWLGTGKGIAVFNTQTNSWNTLNTKSNNLWHNEVSLLFKDSRCDVWIATMEGLNKYLRKEGKIIKMGGKDGLVDFSVHKIAEDSKGNIWLATNEGISKYNSKNRTFTRYEKSENQEKGLSDDFVYSICPDSNNILWIATANGLNKFNDTTGRFEWFFEQDGLINNNIYEIVVLDDGQIGILTPSGLSITDRQLSSFNNYTISDGLHVSGSFLKVSPAKKLHVGGAFSGYYAFSPDSIYRNSAPPPVYITGVKSLTDEYSKEIVNSSKIFRYSDRNIKIKFTALDYTAPQKNKFAYIMEGLDNQWTHLGHNKREIIYNNLKPGKYTFKVIASNNNNVWNTKGDSCIIRILNPWWASWWMYVVYIIFFGILIIFGVTIRNRRKRMFETVRMSREEARLNKEKAEIQKHNEEQKLNFFTNISHEFRTPLSLISIPVDSLLSQPDLPDTVTKNLKLIKTNTNRLQRLANQLIDYRKLTLDEKKIHLNTVELIELIKSIFTVFIPFADKKNINYLFESNRDKCIAQTDVDIIEKVTYNVISNACKNTNINGEIIVKVHISEFQNNLEDIQLQDDVRHEFQYLFQLEVTNTGKGIPAEFLDKIFDRFFQIPQNTNKISDGTGIGLSMVKEYVELLGGHVYVNSEPNNKTTFRLVFPVHRVKEQDNLEHVHTKAGYTEMAGLDNSVPEDDDVTNKQTKIMHQDHQKVMLIVEDNYDLRKLIAGFFYDDFLTLEAQNGREGLQKAVESIPDMIISDVMMPNMDGFEFCTKCKNHELTCHIPIILLTARADFESKLTGIDTGADAYMNKPFREEELKKQVYNLMKNRELIKRKYAEKNNIFFTTPTGNHSDMKFIEKLNKVISENIEDPEFGVVALASKLNMTVRQVQRKFKSLMEQKPADYIKTYRLNKAAAVLSGDNNLSISEVAYAFGFKYPNYFATVFKKQFGISPTDFIKK